MNKIHKFHNRFKIHLMENKMNAEQIQKLAIQTALKLPETTITQPFGPQCHVLKVFDKIFMLTSETQSQKFMNVKVDPHYADELKELYPSIKAGYHMNKKHWVSIFEDSKIDAELIESLVKSSYQLVVNRLSKVQKMRLGLLTNESKHI